ncbi:RNA 2',3'-cyclic phosphodiesterase [Deinococcus aquiradiocola]|uniref:RNA 2',3'-cyclic phosphodiesterase n=1 Tax=Deinococcus aquiradiocola TaxID=393059 RepID=A0A917UUU3_9DEIO|nr:RNA 2',3'-cyclic phosphodiesterase [Deinococcus aquiradiocola]GGJ86748.1 RNA 2',3'-cyclic phosphodiesterase [Deinococcus aquiradiocola]
MTRSQTGRQAGRKPAPTAGGRADSGQPGSGAASAGAGKGQGSKSKGGKGAGGSTQGRPAAPARERTLRLFFGLKLPETTSQDLVAAQAKLTSNWRRVDPDQLHVTLAYLPGVPEGKVAALRDLGKRLAAEAAPMTLRLRGTGYHPNVGTPRVWFVKVEGDGLSELAARLAAELDALGFPVEGKFQPHVTLARKKGPAPRLPPLTFTQDWSATQMHLIHTFLPRDKTGPIYDTVSRFPLTGSAPLPAPTPTATTAQLPQEDDHG